MKQNSVETAAIPPQSVSTLHADGLPAGIAETELRASEQYFRALAEQSLDIVAVLDALGVIRFASPSIEQWTGWKPEEMIGRSAFECIHPDDLPRILKRFHEAIVSPGRIELIEYRYRTKNGEWRAFESWGRNLLTNDLLRGVVIYTRDITERRASERRSGALARLTAHLNMLNSFDAVAGAIATVADELFKWDAFNFALYYGESRRVRHLLNIDTIDGKRVETPEVTYFVPSNSIAGRVIREGPALILRDAEAPQEPMLYPFGDMTRRSASIIAVPVHGRHSILAVIAVHSYTPNAYAESHLQLLQEIAGYCSSALERIQARMELLENESRYRSLVEQLPVGVVVHKEIEGERRIVYANRAVLKLLHADTLQQVVGKLVSEFVPPPLLERVRGRIERAARGEVVSWAEQPLLRLDGTMAEIEVSSFSTMYEGERAVQSILIDISERKLAEQRQAVQYAATRVLAQSTSPGTTAQFLRTICEGLGWTFAELFLVDGVTGRLQLEDVFHPQNQSFRAFSEGARGHTCGRGDGLPGHVWTSRQVIWTVDLDAEPAFIRRELAKQAGLQSVVSFPVMVRDEFAGVIQLFSTTRREQDPAMFELFRVLGTQFGQFIERRQIQQQLVQAQKMDALGQLAGGVAHDFNNLLTVITGHSQFALSTPGLPPQVIEELTQISGAVERGSHLTRHLLTFSRKQVMQPRPLHLNEVLNELAKMLRRIIGEHVTLRLQHAQNLPPILGDSAMIEQVVLNLAVNARDAMPSGGDLIIRTDTVTLDAAQARHNPQARSGTFVRLQVRDTGCGMSPDVLRRLFEPFFTTKPVGQGTGLGLATAYGIVQQHNGWIEVDSHVNIGTTFRVMFPACKESCAALPSAVATEAALRGSNETILLVEDEPSLRRLGRKLLERAGYRIIEAESGHDALAKFRAHRDDIRLVLTDMVMPGGMTGRELAAKLRAEAPGLRIVFTSGYTTELGGNILERENIGFLAKPYSPRQLMQVIHDALHRAA